MNRVVLCEDEQNCMEMNEDVRTEELLTLKHEQTH